MRRGLFEAQNDRPQIRHPQPIRNKPAQNPLAMALPIMGFGRRRAFACYNQHQTGMIDLTLVQKAPQALMRLMLAQTV